MPDHSLVPVSLEISPSCDKYCVGIVNEDQRVSRNEPSELDLEFRLQAARVGLLVCSPRCALRLRAQRRAERKYPQGKPPQSEQQNHTANGRTLLTGEVQYYKRQGKGVQKNKTVKIHVLHTQNRQTEGD